MLRLMRRLRRRRVTPGHQKAREAKRTSGLRSQTIYRHEIHPDDW